MATTKKWSGKKKKKNLLNTVSYMEAIYRKQTNNQRLFFLKSTYFYAYTALGDSLLTCPAFSASEVGLNRFLSIMSYPFQNSLKHLYHN